MKLLIISDTPDPKYWDYYKEGDLDDFDLIISAGDLPAQYLSFLVTLAKCPVFYVHGNHDDSYDRKPPEGCECIEDRVVKYKGLRIGGLGGCVRYKPGVNQYSQAEMLKKARRLRRKAGRKGLDILVTHAPAAGLGDGDDHVHKGFVAFVELLDRVKPRYHIYGHQHLTYNRYLRREYMYGNTHMVNATKSVVIEVSADRNDNSHIIACDTPSRD